MDFLEIKVFEEAALKQRLPPLSCDLHGLHCLHMPLGLIRSIFLFLISLPVYYHPLCQVYVH